MKIPKISYSLIASLNKTNNLYNDLFSISNVGIDMIHYDISNNDITLNFEDIPKFKKCTHLPFDIHISCDSIEYYLNFSFLDPDDRVSIHVENNYEAEDLIFIKNKLNCKLGLAINMETDCEQVFPYLNYIDFVLFMAVKPGVSGMEFDTNILKNIEKFRNNFPQFSITIDGGINDKTAYILKPFCPDVLVSGSFILKEKNHFKQVFKLLGQDLNL